MRFKRDFFFFSRERKKERKRKKRLQTTFFTYVYYDDLVGRVGGGYCFFLFSVSFFHFCGSNGEARGGVCIFRAWLVNGGWRGDFRPSAFSFLEGVFQKKFVFIFY